MSFNGKGVNNNLTTEEIDKLKSISEAGNIDAGFEFEDAPSGNLKKKLNFRNLS
jgi:hypothetical protein